MKKREIALLLTSILFFSTTLYFGINYVRYKDQSTYHRSRMFEYELLSNLYRIFPLGTPLSAVLSKLNLDESALMESSNKESTQLDIIPELPIPANEQRDYSGYYITFENDKLVNIIPIGPDIARNKINLNIVLNVTSTQLKLNKLRKYKHN